MSRLPSLAAVRVFEAAARLQNFTRAADELGMTQAAVSYQIAILEEQLGTAMFVRAHGKVRLTPQAAKVAAIVSAAFGDMREGFATLRGDDEHQLTVSCTNTVATNWLAPRLGRFRVAHPNIDVRLHISDTLVTFDVADVAIRASAEVDPHLHAQMLVPIYVTPMASRTFLARFPLKSPADIVEAQRLSPQDDWWQTWLEAAGESTSEVDRSGLSLESQAAEGAAAIAGGGLAILMPELWSSELRDGRLIAPFALRANTGHKLWIVCQKSLRSAPKIKIFRDWVVAEFKTSIGNYLGRVDKEDSQQR